MAQWVWENVSLGSKSPWDFGEAMLFDYALAEGAWGVSQEQLLCLGRSMDGGMARLTEGLVSGWGSCGSKGRRWCTERQQMLFLIVLWWWFIGLVVMG